VSNITNQLVTMCIYLCLVCVVSLTWMTLSLAAWTTIGKDCLADSYQQRLCSLSARQCFMLLCV